MSSHEIDQLLPLCLHRPLIHPRVDLVGLLRSLTTQNLLRRFAPDNLVPEPLAVAEVVEFRFGRGGVGGVEEGLDDGAAPSQEVSARREERNKEEKEREKREGGEGGGGDVQDVIPMHLPLNHRLIHPMLMRDHMLMHDRVRPRRNPIDRPLSLRILHLQSRTLEHLQSERVERGLPWVVVPLDLLSEVKPLLRVWDVRSGDLKGRWDGSVRVKRRGEERGVVGEMLGRGVGREDGFGVRDVGRVNRSLGDGFGRGNQVRGGWGRDGLGRVRDLEGERSLVRGRCGRSRRKGLGGVDG